MARKLGRDCHEKTEITGVCAESTMRNGDDWQKNDPTKHNALIATRDGHVCVHRVSDRYAYHGER